LQNPFFRESKRNRMEHEYESEREPRSILQVPPEFRLTTTALAEPCLTLLENNALGNGFDT